MSLTRFPRKVVVLLHERDRHADAVPYLLWWMAEAWRREGAEVEVVRGADRFVDADVAVCHVDLTVVPDEYRRLLARYPRVVNGRTWDISKSRVSEHRVVAQGDAWDGPVIVKTDANCGGLPEERILGEGDGGEGRLSRAWRRLLPAARRDAAEWRRRRRIPSEAYPVFASARDVPPEVFHNPALVVERFLPEREGDLYALRLYFFLGDREVSVRALSRDPVIKSGSMLRREDAPLHPGAVAARRRLSLDYGKIDFTVHDGTAAVFDANRTPVFSRAGPEVIRRVAEALAPGIACPFPTA